MSKVNKIYHGDCREILPSFLSNSVDTLITDAPYGLSFMGKKWDYDVPSVETWKKCLRVLKPGGTALIFAGSRTQHRMAVNVEDAGFILKDCIMWIYGSGFPKATDISKQIDKFGGKQASYLRKDLQNILRNTSISKKEIAKYCGVSIQLINFWIKGQRIIQQKEYAKLEELLKLKGNITSHKRKVVGQQQNAMSGWSADGDTKFISRDITTSLTDESQLWDGWKSHGLKPAYEPILVAMKPNDGSYANNALTHGVAGLSIDGGRIPFKSKADKESAVFGRGTDITGGNYVGATHSTGKTDIKPDNNGRFPANVIFDERAAAMLDEQSGMLKSGGISEGQQIKESENNCMSGKDYNQTMVAREPSEGGASRFFYTAKASKAERNMGCDDLENEKFTAGNYSQSPVCKDCGKTLNGTNNHNQCSGDVEYRQMESKTTKNHHPTVKPLDLMRYLARLTKTPTGGIVIDPFCGSGTTLMACVLEGREYIGVEREAEYVEIAESRVAEAMLMDKAERSGLGLDEMKAGQQGLFE